MVSLCLYTSLALMVENTLCVAVGAPKRVIKEDQDQSYVVPRTARQGRAIAEEAERFDIMGVSSKSVPPLHCVMVGR